MTIADYKVGITSIEHLKDLENEIEKLKRLDKLDKWIYDNWLQFDFTNPDTRIKVKNVEFDDLYDVFRRNFLAVYRNI